MSFVQDITLSTIYSRKQLLKELAEVEGQLATMAPETNKFSDPDYCQQVRDNFKYLEATRLRIDTFKEDYKRAQEKHRQYLDLKTDGDKMKGIVSDLLAKVSDKYVLSLKNQLNEVYFAVYQQAGKSVDLQVKESRGKMVITLNIVTKVDKEEFVEDASDEGFGVQITLGIVLLLYFIVQSGLPRVVFFDETFGALSDVTLERFMPVLRAFSDSLGFRFIAVNHDPRLEPFANSVYSVENGKYRKVR